MLCRFRPNFLKDRKNCYVPSFFECLGPCQEDSCPKTHPIPTVSRIKPREILPGRHFFHTQCFLHYSKVTLPKYCGKRALQGRDMSTYRVPKCGRHFVKFDDVTIYPVLFVARTECIKEQIFFRST